jgi:hypothetical protein
MSDATPPRANRNGGNHRPWQYEFAVKFGAIAIVGLYLVWWITSALDGQLKTVLANQNSQLQALQAHTKELLSLRQALGEQTGLLTRELDQHMRMLEVVRYSQYQICINGLKEGMDTRACLGGPSQAHAPQRN